MEVDLVDAPAAPVERQQLGRMAIRLVGLPKRTSALLTAEPLPSTTCAVLPDITEIRDPAK